MEPNLADALKLNSLGEDCIAEEIEAYVRIFTQRNYSDNETKLEVAESICQDARANRNRSQFSLLFELLSARPCVSFSDDLGSQSLLQLKKTQRMARVGDTVFLPQDAEVVVVGDSHGDATSTRHILHEIQSGGFLNRGAYIVFIGDYTSNGVKSWHNLLEVLQFQKKYPESVILLSGNHEYRESYHTALSQFFNTHWERFDNSELPSALVDRVPSTSNHYGHLRLELIREFGFTDGETLYHACADWGLSLPYMCVSGSLLASHSIGARSDQELTFDSFVRAKSADAHKIREQGYEAWRADKQSIHSVMINNRVINTELLARFNTIFGANHFVVGHCHYRSGDTLQLGENAITTIVSSAPYSPDSGHYMYQQMIVERSVKRAKENLPDGNAVAGYLRFMKQQHGNRELELNVIPGN